MLKKYITFGNTIKTSKMKSKIIILLSFFLFINCNTTDKKEHKTVVSTASTEKDTLKSTTKTNITVKDTIKPTKIALQKPLVKKRVKPIKRSKNYRFRKYKHVKDFYAKLSVKATKICMEENIPPAALLAIAGLESGWNKGYIGRITGNILSLGSSARRGDVRLPPLRLPRVIKTKVLLFNEIDIAKYKKSELRYENRPASLKKDYRPAPYAGTTKNLGYLENHPEAKVEAQAQNIKDFVTVFISRTSRIRAYRTTRAQMDALVAKHGKSILLEEKTALAFIYGIGGKKNSYNYRKEWPIKVSSIIRSVGLVPLTKDLYNNKSFEESW